MAKQKHIYICQNCGYQSSQWIGVCPECQKWNTFVEELITESKTSKTSKKSRLKIVSKPIQLSKISTNPPKRLSSNISEFDRVLGGGFVPGQVILLGGEPGIGKSTILTQIAKSLKNAKVLYVCGEESTEQIRLRAIRMNYDAKNMLLLPETDVEEISAVINEAKDLSLVVIDSIQTLQYADFTGFSGSISQVRGCAQILTNTAKSTGVPIVLIGHVTKEGVVAGPKVLEHIVDTVLYLEGDSQHLHRILRTNKNRFGPVSEVGIFEMEEAGMKEITNPSELFVDQTAEKSSGSCITVVMEGYRPLLFEVQALTVRTNFGYPRRTTSGFNVNRLQVLIAILEKRCGLNLSSHDVYLSVAGGFKISEYAADLAVCTAIASSMKDKSVKPKTVVFGECGLNGEVRKVPHLEKRIKEAKKLGYKNVINPQNCKSVVRALKEAM